MGASLEKIKLRILLFSKKNNICYNVNKQNEIVYSFDENKNGIYKIVVYFNIKEYLEAISIYGDNDVLFDKLINIDQNEIFWDLRVENVSLIREDFKVSKLKIKFDEGFIENFNKKHDNEENKYQGDIFEEKNEFKNRVFKIAYETNNSTTAISILSDKFTGSEHQLNSFVENTQPDEHGNINCFFCVNCINCINCIGCVNSNNCVECTNCKSCLNCKSCYNSRLCMSCTCCIDCINCTHCFCGDSLNSHDNLKIGNPFKYKFGNESPDKHYFPYTGSTLYHELIESFFLSNHFIPFHRPYKFACSNNWYIQWSISRKYRRYWVTDRPSSNKKEYFHYELSNFFRLNKIVYRECELFEYDKEKSTMDYGVKDSEKVIDNMLGLFVKIIDYNKCIVINIESISAELIGTKNQIIENSNLHVWKKLNYLPENGHIGEIIFQVVPPKTNDPIFIIRTFGVFYVPILMSGIEKLDVIQIK
jgi:hypothetical protein